MEKGSVMVPLESKTWSPPRRGKGPIQRRRPSQLLPAMGKKEEGEGHDRSCGSLVCYCRRRQEEEGWR